MPVKHISKISCHITGVMSLQGGSPFGDKPQRSIDPICWVNPLRRLHNMDRPQSESAAYPGEDREDS